MSIFSSSESSSSNENKLEGDEEKEDEEGKKDGELKKDKDESTVEQENILIKYATPPEKPNYSSRLRSRSSSIKNRRSQRVINKANSEKKLRSRLRRAKINKDVNENHNPYEEDNNMKISSGYNDTKSLSNQKSIQNQEPDDDSVSNVSSNNASDDDYNFESDYDGDEDDDDDYDLKKKNAQNRRSRNRVAIEISGKMSADNENDQSLVEVQKKIRKTKGNKNFKQKKRNTIRANELSGDDDKYDTEENHGEFSTKSSSSDDYFPSHTSESSSETAKPRKRGLRRKKFQTNQKLNEEFEFDDDMSSSSKESLTLAQLSAKKISRKPALQLIVACPSKIDAITQLPLNDIHICWISPDKKSRQCFNLETLKKVALSSSICIPVTANVADTINVTSNPFNASRRDYLQPPHFRTIMNSEMKDQIVSKFGRQALQLQSFHDEKETSLHNPILPYESPGFDFNDRLNQYIRIQMGNSDLYCCPLCYIEADRRVRIQDTANLRHRNMQNEYSDSEFDHFECETNYDINLDSDNEHLFRDVDFFTFANDPMYILESFDDEFSTAASFCFRKLVDVKKHVREVHNLDTSILDGNELFHQFRIRAPDGLLQRYLKSLTQQSYWAEGHSFDYMHLLHIITIHSEVGPTINPQAYEFSKSFPNRAQKLWEYISAPFLKQIEGELDDFEVSDIDSDENDIQPYMARHLSVSEEGGEKDPHEIMVKVLRAKRGVYDSDSSVTNASGGSDDCVESSNLENVAQLNYEESDEEDEWLKTKRYKPRHKSQRHSKRLVKEGHLLTNHSTNKSTSSASSPEIQASSSQRNRKIVCDDTKLVISHHSNKRKRVVYESSDDDDE